MLLLACSCLQSRSIDAAASELLALQPDGLQLTPGNIPVAGFVLDAPCRTHHGFSWTARRTNVWAPSGKCIVDADSVHPPRTGTAASQTWKDHLRPSLTYETMYPGYELGNGDELLWAMDNRLSLAVDISHIYLQQRHGVLDNSVWRAIMEYDRIAEIHVSANRGRADTHQPIDRNTFGLAWAKDHLRNGQCVVLESYFHKLSYDERMRQLDLLR